MNKSKKIQVASFIVLCGFVFSVFFHYWQGMYLGRVWPYNTFLFGPKDRFMDFFSQLQVGCCFNPYYERPDMESMYLPFAYILVYIFSLIKPWGMSLFVYFVIFVVYFLLYSYKNISGGKGIEDAKNVFILSFLTYPFLFSIDRANFENLLFIFLSAFVVFYYKNKKILSVIFLSCAIAMKAYPIVFIVLFISDKKYKEAFGVLILSILLLFGSLALLKSGVVQNIYGVLKWLNYHKMAYGIGDGGVHYNSSLYGMIKVFLYRYYPDVFINNAINLAEYYKIYLCFSMFIFLLLALYVIFVEKIVWRKISLLIFAQLLLPYMTGDYKLMYVFVPLYMLINDNKADRNSLFCLVMFSLLLIPKNYWFISGDASISVVINPLIMIIVSVVIVITGFKYNNRVFTKI